MVVQNTPASISFAVPIVAQVQAGWKVRIDGSQGASALDANPNLTFATMGKGFHVTGGPGAIIWDPAHTVKGVYNVKATFTLMKKEIGRAHV